MNFSIPIKKRLKKKNLLKKIYTLKKQPKAIPYVTSYYKKIGVFVLHMNLKEMF